MATTSIAKESTPATATEGEKKETAATETSSTPVVAAKEEEPATTEEKVVAHSQEPMKPQPAMEQEVISAVE